MENLVAVTAAYKSHEKTLNLIGALRSIPFVRMVVVVDNCPADPLRPFLSEQALQDPALCVVALRRNVGVAGAWNLGIRIALAATGPDAILIAGNDTLPCPGTVERLASLIDDGACFVTGTSMASYATELAPVPTEVPADLELVYSPDFSFFMFKPHILSMIGNGDVARDMELQRRGKAEACLSPWTWGLFDEGFWPAYFEDNDFHLRAEASGVICVRDPGAFFAHACSSALAEDPQLRTAIQTRLFRENADKFRSRYGKLPHECQVMVARPGNINDDEWRKMTAGRPVRVVPRQELLAQARAVYGQYGVKDAGIAEEAPMG